MISIDPLIAIALIGIFASLITYLLNERSKRRWELADEIWKRKSEEFRTLFLILDEFVNLIEFKSLLWRQLRPKVALKDDSDEYWEEAKKTMTAWRKIKKRYLGGRTKFIEINLEKKPPCTRESLKRKREELVEELDMAMYERTMDLLLPLAELKLLCQDDAIFGEVIQIRDKVNMILECPPIPDDYRDQEDLQKLLGEIKDLLDNIKRRAREDTDMARTGRINLSGTFWTRLKEILGLKIPERR